MLTRWTRLGLVALTSVVLCAAVNAADSPAPAFSLPARGGSTIDLAQFKGQVVMINFWASWCVPCRKEMPLLDSIYKKYKPMGFTLLSVNVEPEQKDAESFLTQTPVSFPVLFDAKSKVSGLYNVQGMPTTVFIDRKGTVRLMHVSYNPGDENLYMDQNPHFASGSDNVQEAHCSGPARRLAAAFSAVRLRADPGRGSNPTSGNRLADPIMSFDRNPISSQYMEHVFDVRAAARGGNGAAGGGCGCN